MSWINRDKNFYGWIGQKLEENFKYEIDSTIDSEKLSLWLLYYLKKKLKINEKIYEIFKEIFGKTLNQISGEKVHVWFGFDPNSVPLKDLFNSIFRYLIKEAYNDFVKKNPKFKNFIEFDSSYLEEILQEPGDIDSRVISVKPELGVKFFNVEGSSFDVKELKNYSKFEETIEKFKSEYTIELEVAWKALLLYDLHSKPLDIFERKFGNDKNFKERYYTIWERYWKLSPHFFPVKECYYNHDPKKSDKENRGAMLQALFSAIKGFVEKAED